MAIFDIAYSKTSLAEGGEKAHSNRLADRGGETFGGISRKFNPNWEGWSLVDSGNISEAIKLVKPFYKEEFWKRLLLDQVIEQSLADEIFDTAANLGRSGAVSIVQLALKMLRQNIIIDGVMGYKTISIINAYKYPKSLLKVLNGLQFMHYYELVQKDPTQIENFRGWMERV